MSEDVTNNAEEVQPSLEEQVAALLRRVAELEGQVYMIYIQENTTTKLLLDKNILDKDEFVAEMDELNKQVFEATKEMMEKEAAGVTE